MAGVEAFSSKWYRVTLQGCKLDSVNFRDAQLTEVVFDNCILRDVDFTGAALTRAAFGGSRLSGVTFSHTTLDQADLRGAQLGLATDAESLRGAIVTSAQLAEMAALLAEAVGITVDG